MKSITIACFAGLALGAHAQLLVFDDLDAPVGPLNGVTSGSPWGAGWNVQSAASLNGQAFQIIDEPFFPTYVDSDGDYLALSGNYMVAGNAFLGAARVIDPTDPSLDPLTGNVAGVGGGLVGDVDGVYWASWLVRRRNGNEAGGLSFHGDTGNNTGTGNRRLGVARSGGNWRLEVRDNGGATNINGQAHTVDATSIGSDPGQTRLIVVRVNTGSWGSTVDLFIDPDQIGGAVPSVADATVSTTNDLGFGKIRLNNGGATQSHDYDEFRVGLSYADVTPIQAVDPVTLTTPSPLPGGQQGLPYTAALAATGGIPAGYTFATTNGSLPAGLMIDGPEITGTPTVDGTFNFDLVATDIDGNFGTSSYTLTIDPPQVVITTTQLQKAVENSYYYTEIAAASGPEPYSFVLDSGTLPAGLTLNSDGSIDGVPTQNDPSRSPSR